MSFTKASLPSSFLKEMDGKPSTVYKSLTFGNALSLRVDEGTGAMTISPSGRDVALASRSGLDIIDLDDPFSPPRRLPHATSWEVADVQWSPHASKPSWVISTSNQKALVWNLALPSSRAIEHMLHGHQRAITDINFHGFQPEMIATCSVDSYVHVWDLRDSRKLVQSFADWEAGATQVKWNRRNPHLVASSHDRKVHIWDSRKGSNPLHTLYGHDGKVNGLDFSREEETIILTCSNDRTVKQWDYEASNTEPRKTIETDFPVWRARHTPFGDACIIMPLRGGNNTVYMNDMRIQGDTKLNPLHGFKGHSDPVKEFVWRTRGGNTEYEDREFQLVTWSKDHDLKLWPLAPSVLEAAHYEKGAKLKQRITRKGSSYTSYQSEPRTGKDVKSKHAFSLYGLSPETKKGKNERAFMTGGGRHHSVKSKGNEHLHWISGVRIGNSAFAAPFDNTQTAESSQLADHAESTPANLGEEVGIVGHKFPKVRFENISVATGDCVVSLNGPWGTDETCLVFLRVELKFPHNYPYAAPKFKIEDQDTYEQGRIQEILTELTNIANNLTQRGKYCLEPCLRYLLGDKISLSDYDTDHNTTDEVMDRGASLDESDDEDLADLQQDFSYSSSSEEELIDSQKPSKKMSKFDSTPVPKGCGAVWAKSGQLICFFTQRKDARQNNTNSGGSQLLPRFGGVAPLTRESDPPVQSEADETDSMSNSDEDFFDKRLGIGTKQAWGTGGRSGVKTNFRIRQPGPRSAMSDRSNTATGTAKLDRDKNVVKSYDFQYLIPSKRYLACDYQVMGDAPAALAKHNAHVAAMHDAREVADCWSLLEMLLSNSIPLEDTRLDSLPGFTRFGLFEWDDHPLGKKWMVRQLFDYFEKQNNTQMLANMSCVLSARTTTTSEAFLAAAARLDLSFAYPRSPFSQDGFKDYQYSPQTPTHASYREQQQTATSHTSSSLFISARSAPWDIPNSQKSQPPTVNPSPVSSKDDSSIISLSPEKFMTARKAVAGIFSRNNSAAVGGASQPVKVTRWQHSGNSGANNNNNVVRLSSTPPPPNNEESVYSHYMNFTSGSTQTASRNSFLGSDGGDFGMLASNLPKINIEFIDKPRPSENMGITPFLQQAGSSSLLELENEPRYRKYRWQYAAMLFSWGLEIQSLEVLKYNFNLRPGIKSNLFKTVHSTAVEMRIDEADPNSRRHTKTCHYCQLIVKTRFFQCTNCEHLLHADCARDWWDVNGGRECASGCGCLCLDYV